MSTTPPVLVSATRAGAEDFHQHTLLGRSLQVPVHSGWQPQIRTSNRQPLAEVYNQAIEQADPASLLLFCHDDVWLGEDSLLQPLEQALQRFDLVGVAGNRHLLPGHSTWCFNPLDGSFDLMNLVGAIRHGSPQHSTLTVFGPSPAEAALLDGVFLAARAGVLQQAGVRFDPDLAFHFYDLDVCRTALAAGLRLGVWPLPLIQPAPATSATPAGRQPWPSIATSGRIRPLPYWSPCPRPLLNRALGLRQRSLPPSPCLLPTAR